MFLAKSLSQAARKLGITEVVFSDNDPEKLAVYGTLAKKTAAMIMVPIMVGIISPTAFLRNCLNSVYRPMALTERTVSRWPSY